MSHHSEQPFNKELTSFSAVKEVHKFNEDIFRKIAQPEIGATNNFPDGQLNEDDEGEIRFSVTLHEEKIIMEFGKPVRWIGLTPEQAQGLAISLLEKIGKGCMIFAK